LWFGKHTYRREISKLWARNGFAVQALACCDRNIA
jgi:hypothetical protein